MEKRFKTSGRLGRFIIWRLVMLLILVIVLPVISQDLSTPRRIVSLAPHITEIVFKLGAGDRLVGRTDFCNYPAAAAAIESVGGYLNIDFEKIVRLQPDLILQFPNSENRRKLELLGFRVAGIPNETVAEILEGIGKTGDLLGFSQRAREIVAGIEDTLQMIRARLENPSRPLQALLLVGREPGSLKGLYAAGSRTYLSELLNYCSVRNAFAEVKSRYFSVDKESLLKRQIDVILEFHTGWNLTPQQLREEKSVWRYFSNLNAVKQGNIFIFSQRFYLIPGPRIAKTALEISRIVQKIRRQQTRNDQAKQG